MKKKYLRHCHGRQHRFAFHQRYEHALSENRKKKWEGKYLLMFAVVLKASVKAGHGMIIILA